MMIWTRSNGEKIEIKDMETAHIINCIKVINEERRLFESKKEKDEWLVAFEKELEKRKPDIFDEIEMLKEQVEELMKLV